MYTVDSHADLPYWLSEHGFSGTGSFSKPFLARFGQESLFGKFVSWVFPKFIQIHQIQVFTGLFDMQKLSQGLAVQCSSFGVNDGSDLFQE